MLSPPLCNKYMHFGKLSAPKRKTWLPLRKPRHSLGGPSYTSLTTTDPVESFSFDLSTHAASPNQDCPARWPNVACPCPQRPLIWSRTFISWVASADCEREDELSLYFSACHTFRSITSALLWLKLARNNCINAPIISDIHSLFCVKDLFSSSTCVFNRYAKAKCTLTSA